MDAAPPEAAEPQEEAEPQAQARKRSWWRVRIPTSILVTLVGIALTAWLLPAFTKQWDDRQKAQELKVGLVRDMATATARALTESHDLMVSSSYAELGLQKQRLRSDLVEASWEMTPPSVKQWARDSVRIESVLRAHVGPRQATAWRKYRHVVDRFLAHSTGREFGPQADPHPEPRPKDLEKLNDRTQQVLNDRNSTLAEAKGQTDARDKLVNLEIEAATLQEDLLRYEEKLGQQVLAAHVAGYSTTSRDLIHDLLPF